MGICRGSIPLLLFATLAHGQRQPERPTPLDPAQAERNARELISEVLAQKPDRNSSKNAVLKIRDPKDVETEIPVHIEVRLTPTNWATIYETTASGKNPPERLEVTHSADQPNNYQLTIPAPSAAPKMLAGGELMRPFAGSDFWIADLGLEFLHWPKQRVLMNDMRHHKSCSVLESRNPRPAPGGYARVMSWITVDTPHVVVHAEAFDSTNQLLKKFDPKNLEKVNGQYELESMEIRSPKPGSRTILEFDLK